VLGRRDGIDLNHGSFAMHCLGSSVRLLVVGGLLGLASCGGGGGSPSPQAHDPQSMQNMNMDQMMEHCRQMQGMDRSRMSPDMQQMMQQCDAMMRAHGGGSATGSSSP
jgi:hypothetical protein